MGVPCSCSKLRVCFLAMQGYLALLTQTAVSFASRVVLLIFTFQNTEWTICQIALQMCPGVDYAAMPFRKTNKQRHEPARVEKLKGTEARVGSGSTGDLETGDTPKQQAGTLSRCIVCKMLYAFGETRASAAQGSLWVLCDPGWQQ